MINVANDPVYSMLFEKQTRSKSKVVVVSNVRGRIPVGMKLATPEEVFKNLKIAKVFTGPILESIRDLINMSRKTTQAMNKAYGDSRFIEDKEGKKGLLVSAKGIDRPNATRYMKLLLESAYEGGIVRGGEDTRVENSSGGVLIFPSKRGKVAWRV